AEDGIRDLTVTGVQTCALPISKTLEGAWIVLLLIPIIVGMFKATRRHYSHVAAQLTLKGYAPPVRRHNTVLIPIGGIQRAVVERSEERRVGKEGGSRRATRA